MRHLLLGRTPLGPLGLNSRSLPMEGTVDTINAGIVGARSATGPSARLIVDLGKRLIHSVVAGGASGRPFSPWYRREVRAWLKGKYKTVGLGREA